MNVIHPRCAAIDLGKDVLVAALRVQEGSRINRESRSYGTTTAQVIDLTRWLWNPFVPSSND